MMLLTKAVLVLLSVFGCNCFNISPNPNIVIRDPAEHVKKSSYFGFAINLRKSSVLIGAPKATKNENIKETGGVIKCDITTLKDPNCYPYKFHANVNANFTNAYFESENNEYQMLGSTMDGFGSETDKFVVCAPNLKNVRDTGKDRVKNYYLNGGCFMIQNSEKSETSNVTDIMLTKEENNQIFSPGDRKAFHHHKFAQQGFSVHVTENSSEILMGAPGVYLWSGSIIRYRGENQFDILHPHDTVIKQSWYFGYAVTSAQFNKPEDDKTYYAASAPRVLNNKEIVGEILIYDIQNKVFILQKTLLGSQTGEYFGYSLLVEDFNNDGLPDLAVSAPLHSADKYYENGAVYIYLNEGKMNLVIQPLIKSKFKANGRFGTAFSKIGDINMDGYNDIAISSPFEENGVVYIYLGGPEGLSSTPSQKIEAPIDTSVVPVTRPMFGHSISRGVDIDNNGYNDIAIGDPSSGKVYIYRSYPVVKIVSSITPLQREIFTNTTSFEIKACAYHSSVIKSDIDFIMTIIIDGKYNRAFFEHDSNQKSESIKLNAVESCKDYIIQLRKLTEIYEPIEIEMKIKILNNIPQIGNKFCTDCVIFDSKETATVSSKVALITGCDGAQCISNLFLVGDLINVDHPYVMGTTKTIAIQYEISNTGENAYLTQLMISIPTNVTQLTKIPPNCKLSNKNSLLTCSIMDGKPLIRNQKTNLLINLDMSRIQGSTLRVNASVTCAGINTKEKTNSFENIIMLSELSDIYVTSLSSDSNILIDDFKGLKEITYNYKIFNNGPSIVREMIIIISVPTKYILKPNNDLTIIDLDEGSISCQYDNNKLQVVMLDHVTDDTKTYYSGVIENQIVSTLPENKTIYFNCTNQQYTTCTDLQIDIQNFKPNNEPIEINIKMAVNLDNIDKVFELKKDFNLFLYNLNAKIHRVGEGKLKVSITNPYTVIAASLIANTPYLTIVISTICGILVLVLVIYILFKLGFFKRAKKAEIKKYRRDSRRMTLRLQEAALILDKGEEALEDEVFTSNCNEMVKQLQATQQLKNLTDEDIVEEKDVSYQSQSDKPQTRISQSRASYKVIKSITLETNKS